MAGRPKRVPGQILVIDAAPCDSGPRQEPDLTVPQGHGFYLP